MATALTDETGSGYVVFSTSPTFSTSIDGGASFAAFASSSTLTLGYSGASASTTNISTGAADTAVTKTINVGTGGVTGSTTNINFGSANGTGTSTFNNDVVVVGDLTVQGTTTTVSSTTINVADKNLELGSNDTPTDVTANGGGITLKGATDKTFNWVNATDAWTSSENIDLASDKSYYINGTSVLSSDTLGSGVTKSSLVKLGLTTAGFVTTDASGNISVDSNTYLTSASTLDASKLSGTIPSTVLGNSTVYIGTTSVALNRASAGLALTGISSVALPGSTSGAITLQPAAVAGTNTITLPATTGTVVTTGDTGTVTNTMLANSSITINGNSVSLGGSATFTANVANSITLKFDTGSTEGTDLYTFNGSAAKAIDFKAGSNITLTKTAGSITIAAASEADTLASVTARGATTSVASTFSGGITTTTVDKKVGSAIVAQEAVVQATVASTTSTAVDTWAAATYRSAKYVVQLTQGTDYQVSEMMVIHNGTTTSMTEYAVLETNGPLATFTSDISGTDVRLIITMASNASTAVNIVRTAVAV